MKNQKNEEQRNMATPSVPATDTATRAMTTYPVSACRMCDGDGEIYRCMVDTPSGRQEEQEEWVFVCPRCQGSGRELASLMDTDRIGGRHGER